jgi:phage terminase small subunit
MSKVLTANQEAFAQNIIQGMSQADAYRAAYPKQNMSDKTLWEAASRLMRNDKVVARINELRQELVSPKIMSAQKRLEWLTEVIQNNEESTSDRLKAADLMNKMQGEYVQKVEAAVKNAVNISIELSDE